MTDLSLPLEAVERLPREWGYPEAIAVLTGMTIGFMTLQAAQPVQMETLGTAKAAAIVFNPLLLALLAGALLPKHRLVRFFSGVPFAITALAFTAIGALAGTLILQNPSSADAAKLGAALPALRGFGLTDVFHSLWFTAQVGALLICTVMAAGRRVFPVSFKNLVFLTTHIGTALVLAGGILGNLSSMAGNLVLQEGQSSGLIELERGGMVDLPTPIQLRSFHVDPFPLEATLATIQGDSIQPRKGGKALPDLHAGSQFTLDGWKITCESAFPSARRIEESLIETPDGPMLAMDLQVRTSTSRQEIQLTSRLEIVPILEDAETVLMEVKPGEVAQYLPSAMEAARKQSRAGVYFLSDGREIAMIIRSLDGGVTSRVGPEALKPVVNGRLTLEPLRLYRARTTGGWVAQQGVRPQPTGAARVIAEKKGLRREGWLATGPGSFEYLPLDEDRVLMLLEPSPKTYRSEITVAGREQSIRVNDPLMHHGWQLSQASYQVSPEGAVLSILGARKDPSIPVVWTGLTMLLIGTLGALWMLPGLLKEGGAQ